MNIRLILIFSLCLMIHINSSRIKLRSDESHSQRAQRLFFFNKFSKAGSFSNFIRENRKKINFLSNHFKQLKDYFRIFQSSLNRHKSFENQIRPLNIRELGDELLYGPIGFGTPPQFQNLCIDTGSPTLWTVSSECPLSECPHGGYNKKLSSSYEKVDGANFSLGYGTDGGGTVNLTFAQNDTVSIAGYSVKNVNFGAAYYVDMEGFTTSGWNGIIGLWQNATYFNNLIDDLAEQKSISSAIFSYYLSEKDYWIGSKLIIGGVDNKYFSGNIKYYPNIGTYFWQLKVDYLSIGGKKITVNTVVLDSGTSNIVGPKKQIEEANKLLGPINLDCSKNVDLPEIVFSISGDLYPLKKFLYSNSDVFGSCISPFRHEGQPFWIIGSTFFQNYYTVYDISNNRIGFATIKHPLN